MSDNVQSEVWILRLSLNEGKEVKTLNVTLPAGTTVDYVEHQKKNVVSKTLPVKKDEEVKTSDSPLPPPKPAYIAHPSYFMHGNNSIAPMPYYYHQHGGMHHANILMPTPQHPMFLNPSGMPKQALTEDQVAEMQKAGASPSSPPEKPSKELVIKSFEDVAKKPKDKKIKSNIKHAASSSTEELIDSPLPDKDFDRKENQKRSYSDVASSNKSAETKPAASSSSNAQKQPKKASTAEPTSSKKKGSIVDTKPPLQSLISKKPVESNYSPISDDYPAAGGYDFFNFHIPQIFKDSPLAKKFPQSFKYKLITRAVGYQNMQKVQTFWTKTPKSGFKPDYNSDTTFYFTPFYFWRAVFGKDGEKIDKCHIFNRFHANGKERQCRYGPEDCKFYHMCMICGSTSHSAFQRKSEEDTTYVCKEHAKLVAERKQFLEQGILDSNFTEEINYYENLAMEELEQQINQSEEEVILKVDQTPALINNTDIFPPLPAKSPARKKKGSNKKDNKTPETPIQEAKTPEKETERAAADSPKPASSSSQ